MKLSRREARLKRKKRIRKKISGKQHRPRMVVFRSNKHIYAQIINDEQGYTYVASSTLSLKDISKLNKENAKLVGKRLAEKAKDINIEKVVFDRNGYKYHGRIKELADGAREAGLKF